MELELGLKITRARDDVSSSTDFKVSRDVFGRLWHSRETDSVFILTLHLKGFKKDGIDTEINKEGDQITIRGRKQVEEMVLIKWVKWRKETEIKEFKKMFRIPEIVNLDKIKAKFNEEDGILKVTFPKKVKGMTGLKIEELEEVEPEAEKTEEKTEPEAEEKTELETDKTEEKPEIEEEIKGEDEEEQKMEEEEEGIVEEEETRDHEEDIEETNEKESKPKRQKRKKFCFPCVAGSTLLMSVIVFIIQLIQSKRK